MKNNNIDKIQSKMLMNECAENRVKKWKQWTMISHEKKQKMRNMSLLKIYSILSAYV